MKYIDADRLRAAIKEHTLFYAGQANLLDGTNTLDGYDEVLAIIDSLQQEQQEKKEVKFVFPKFLYARTTNNKTIDVSYAPQSLDAIEYIRSDSLQQEQPSLPGIEENSIPGKDFIPVGWVDACEKYGKWKIVKVEQPAVKGWVARDKDGMLRMHEEKPKRSKCLWESTGASHDISEFFSDNFIDWGDEPIEAELVIGNARKEE